MEHAPLFASHRVVTLDAALAALAAVRSEAEGAGVALGVVVVDPRGVIVASARMDGAQFVALDLAAAKAFTAAAFSAPSGAWSTSSAPGGSDWGLDGTVGGRITAMAGGVPWFVDGELIGAVGASGAAASVDTSCVEKALARLS
ncbi:heme-binding protein [Amnibacterium flavum]|uniref:Cobalamin adenosyltransferase n=1 Tax=Amnibacterium flavum TaxID=2173173 RepID=A0A2V1HPQ2_9MICO|nr:heme-binding protein [Amnibacterium flavum]PVZ94518.1 hypothetical protein DDQ50_12520 [Amnibacterium flavum]